MAMHRDGAGPAKPKQTYELSMTEEQFGKVIMLLSELEELEERERNGEAAPTSAPNIAPGLEAAARNHLVARN